MHATIIQTDDAGFETTVLRAPEPVLVEFWAAWCPPCKVIAPFIEELATQYEGRLRVVTVNSDDNLDLAARCGVVANPSLVFFAQGREVHRLVGGWPKAKIAAAIEQVLASALS